MNPLDLFKPGKTEIRIILVTLSVILMLPILAVYSAAHAGVSAVSGVLAFVNPLTHLVEIHGPTGNLETTLNVTTTWPVQGKVTTEFGAPTLYQLHHTGTDIADKAGDAITPFMAGKVITVQNDSDNPTGFGRYVAIDHGNAITSIYGHMSQTNATLGQDVQPGDIIGYEGNTGHSLGNHVHFEVRVYNIPVNPRTFISGDPVRGY